MAKIRTFPFDQAYIRRVLDYDPSTGVLTWKWRDDMPLQWNRRRAGKVAGNDMTAGGCGANAHRTAPTARNLVLHHTTYYAHRIIWLWFYGEPVPDEIDHKDRNPLNNRINNLRAATRSQSRWNSRGDGISGVKNVNRVRQKWVVRFWLKDQSGKSVTKHCGTYRTLKEATAVARKKRKELFGEYACHATF